MTCSCDAPNLWRSPSLEARIGDWPSPLVYPQFLQSWTRCDLSPHTSRVSVFLVFRSLGPPHPMLLSLSDMGYWDFACFSATCAHPERNPCIFEGSFIYLGWHLSHLGGTSGLLGGGAQKDRRNCLSKSTRQTRASSLYYLSLRGQSYLLLQQIVSQDWSSPPSCISQVDC